MIERMRAQNHIFWLVTEALTKGSTMTIEDLAEQAIVAIEKLEMHIRTTSAELRTLADKAQLLSVRPDTDSEKDEMLKMWRATSAQLNKFLDQVGR